MPGFKPHLAESRVYVPLTFSWQPPDGPFPTWPYLANLPDYGHGGRAELVFGVNDDVDLGFRSRSGGATEIHSLVPGSRSNFAIRYCGTGSTTRGNGGGLEWATFAHDLYSNPWRHNVSDSHSEGSRLVSR